ncbi:MAG: MBL fold metallo-hydrolase [bacterium]|nr:MBL fold metallo-hydrolase [bacterium]
MKIQLIRNATMKITYAGKTILTDPMFSDKHAMDPFAGIERNPTIGLPLQKEDIAKGIDGVIVSHYHPDHLDQPAMETLAKEIPMFCQPGDEGKIAEGGFQDVTPIAASHTWEGITITRTGGKHGKGQILQMMGEVSGFVLQAEGEPTVYWIGDSIWCQEVENAVKQFSPDIIITHSGGAIKPGHEAIIMDGEQTLRTAKAAPQAKVVAIHMESLDHCTVDRKTLRKMAEEASVPQERLIIPADGETLEF